MNIIEYYFPLPTYAIVTLGTAYFIYGRIWKTEPSRFMRKALAILLMVFILAVLNVIMLTTPLLAGSALVDNLSQLLIWIWPDITVLVLLVADLGRFWRKERYHTSSQELR